jgi:hypothetical protein
LLEHDHAEIVTEARRREYQQRATEEETRRAEPAACWADLLPQRLWALRKGEHEAAIDLKAVPGIGAEIVLTVDGEMRKTRLFRSYGAGGTGGCHRGHAGDVRG